jgi:hypothetical protein
MMSRASSKEVIFCCCLCFLEFLLLFFCLQSKLLLTWYPTLFCCSNSKKMETGFAVMVQLFNVPDITNKLIEDHNLLECFTTVFCDVISRCTKGYIPYPTYFAGGYVVIA